MKKGIGIFILRALGHVRLKYVPRPMRPVLYRIADWALYSLVGAKRPNWNFQVMP